MAHHAYAALIAAILTVGCASQPAAAPKAVSPAPTAGAALAGGEWKVEDIGGTAVLPNVPVTIEFKEGRVFGAGSCNRFMGGYEAGDAFSIKLGQMASSMMACPDAQMAQERKFLDLLAQVTSYSIDSTGALILKTADGKSIKARRA